MKNARFFRLPGKASLELFTSVARSDGETKLFRVSERECKERGRGCRRQRKDPRDRGTPLRGCCPRKKREGNTGTHLAKAESEKTRLRLERFRCARGGHDTVLKWCARSTTESNVEKVILRVSARALHSLKLYRTTPYKLPVATNVYFKCQETLSN